MTKRYLVGGPNDSGKSTFVLSLAELLRRDYRLTVEALELDVWSRSYPAFRGEIAFQGRPKQVGLDWDWQTPLDAVLEQMRSSTADIVIGDMPGKLDTVIDHMCLRAAAHAGMVVSRTLEGLAEWEQQFTKHGLPIAGSWLTFPQDKQPLILTGMNRVVDPNHDHVAVGAAHLVRDMLHRRS